MRVVVLTTSYPRHPGDVAGVFVHEGVERLRAAGVQVDVVSPQDFAHHGIAYGHGIVGNLRERPARALRLPEFLGGYRRAAARAARGADLVHAHWLPSGAVAATLGVPFVVQLWGSDVALARKAPWLARPVLRRARAVICASSALAADARALGAREVRVIPSGIDLPPPAGPPDEPPHLLYVGRLAPEKGVAELAAAVGAGPGRAALPLEVVGDGPLRARLPGALGFVPPGELAPHYARAAVVVCPSLREGFGMAALEALAHGRPVVASATGGLLDIVEDGVTGIHVPPGDATALRAALERLLGDAALRERMGAAARARVAERFSWEASTAALLAVYAALRSPRSASTST